MIKKQNKCENLEQEKEIRNFVCKMHEYQMTEIPGNRELSQKYQMSELFYQKMEKLIRQQYRKAKKKEIRRGIMAAAAVIMLLVMISHPQYIAEAGEKIMEWFSDHVSFQFKEDSGVNWVPRYEMEYVPEGYELVTDEYYENAGIIEWVDNEENRISFAYATIDGEMNLDNEEKTFSIIKGENGEKIYYLKANRKEDESSITWTSEDETTLFNVIGALGKEELLNIQQNIKIKNNN